MVYYRLQGVSTLALVPRFSVGTRFYSISDGGNLALGKAPNYGNFEGTGTLGRWRQSSINSRFQGQASSIETFARCSE